MPGCVIRSCPSRRSQQPEAVLHAFPRNVQRIRCWLERTGHRFKDMDAFITRILEAKKSDGYGICSAHFTANCYMSSGEGRVLRVEAVPTIFPPGDKLISEVIQLRVSRKARQARLQNAAKPADSASGLAGVGTTHLSALAAKMDAETQTEAGYPSDPTEEQKWRTRIKEEPGDRPALPSGTQSGTVKYEYWQGRGMLRNNPSDVQRSDGKRQSHLSHKILQLTLEILYLLTGEDYGPIKESGDHVTRSLILEPTPERPTEQKILKVTNQIIELLTGEVPVRCQDVTMDEQEHKQAMMESPPPLRPLDVTENAAGSINTLSVSDKKKRGRRSRKWKDGCGPPVNSTGRTCGDHLAQSVSTPNNNEQSSSSEEHLPPQDIPRRTRHKLYPSSQVQEKHLPRGKRLPKPNVSTRTRRSLCLTPVQQQPNSSEEHPPCSDISPHTELPISSSKEHFPSGEEHLPHPDISTIAHRRQKRSPHVKKETNSCKEEHSGDEIDYKPIVVEQEEESSMSSDEEPFTNFERSIDQGHLTTSQQDASESEEHFKFSDHFMASGNLQTDVLDMPTHDGEEEPLLSEDGLYTDATAPKFPVDFSATAIHKRFLNHPEYFDRSLFCPECGKSFTDKARVAAHLRTHWGEKAYCCSMCPKTFRSQSRLVVHQMMHSGEKPYHCLECGKRFAQNSYLQRHMMCHTGEKPFPCSICGKGFACKSDMVKHELTHTGARPHPCLVCSKRFTKKSHLNRHMRIHTGEKPFCCPDCGRSFGCNSDMVSHQRIHQGIKPFSCSDCGKSFLRKQDAIRHQTIHRV